MMYGIFIFCYLTTSLIMINNNNIKENFYFINTNNISHNNFII